MPVISVGRVDKHFIDLLRVLKSSAADNYLADSGEGQHKWFTPPGFTSDLLDTPALHRPAFEREDLNTNYNEIMKNPNDPGSISDAAGIKRQIDYVAAAERAWRARHCSTVRMLAHGSARQLGFGYGEIFDRIREEVESRLASGATAAPAGGAQ